MDLGLLLTMAASGMLDRLAVGPRSDALSYAELLERAKRTGRWLSGHDVHNIAFLDVNSAAFPLLLFGSAFAGKPFAPINYRLADDRVEAILARLAPALLVVDDAAAERVFVPGIEVVTRSSILAAIEGPRGDAIAAAEIGSGDAPAVLLFTSGTSAEPKAAVLRNRHLFAYVVSTVELGGAGEDEAALVSVPPYHIAGISAVLSSVYGGRRIVYLPTFQPAEWVRVVREEEITHAMVVPTMLARILDVLERSGDRLPTLRHISYGGGRMPLPVIERALELLDGVNFVNAYGLTETSSTVTLLAPDDHREAVASNDPVVRRRLGSVGRPVPGIELQIRDAAGAPLGAGTRGEIWLRGEQVSGEYVGSEVGTSDGWFDTKDVGELDDAGFLFLEGRSDDVIVRGGENLSPGEIEDVLARHPAVADAAVVGVPDSEWGQIPVAVVVAVDGEDPAAEELRTWVRSQLRSSRMPERVVFVDELPYGPTGKLLRRVVRDQLKAPESADE